MSGTLQVSRSITRFKSNHKNDICNYRSISLISNIIEIVEMTHISTDALAEIAEFLYEKWTESNPTIVTFFDFSKAFDTVNYSKLFYKLDCMSVRGLGINWLKAIYQIGFKLKWMLFLVKHVRLMLVCY